MSLENRARQLIAKASIVAEGPGADFVPAGKRAYSDRDPSGHSWSLADAMIQRFAKCDREHELLRAIHWAEAVLERALRSPESVPESEAQRDERVLFECEGWQAERVVASEDLTLRQVWSLRIKNGRTASEGLVMEGAAMKYANKGERVRRAQELAEQGMSARQIALQFGVSHPTILDDLRTEEAA